MKTDHNGQYIALNKKLIAGALAAAAGALAAVAIHHHHRFAVVEPPSPRRQNYRWEVGNNDHPFSVWTLLSASMMIGLSHIEDDRPQQP
jgi:hypothetical protein